MLVQEVQSIDGSQTSIKKVTQLLIDSYDKNRLPKSAVQMYSEILSKYMLDWMGKANYSELKKTNYTLLNILRSDDEIGNPFEELNSKQELGGVIHYVTDLIDIYFRHDISSKDISVIIGNNKTQIRFRKLLKFAIDKARPISANELSEHEIYKNKNYTSHEITEMSKKDIDSVKKQIYRDLIKLDELDFLKATRISPKKIVYEVTNKTRQLEKQFFASSEDITRTGVQVINLRDYNKSKIKSERDLQEIILDEKHDEKYG